MKLVICGEGGLGHEVLDLVLELQEAGLKSYDEILFLDDDVGKAGYMGYRAAPSCDIFENCGRDDTRFVIAVGEPAHRIKFIREIKGRGYRFETLVHPTARLGSNTSIGDGTVVQWGSFISCDCRIGENCFLQPSCSVGHGCAIGDGCTVSTNVAISGDVTVGDGTYLAVGVSVLQGMRIGSNSVVGMGSVVLRDIPDNVIAMGNPARPMKNKDNQRVFSQMGREGI